jgi:hypothetical protein
MNDFIKEESPDADVAVDAVPGINETPRPDPDVSSFCGNDIH